MTAIMTMTVPNRLSQIRQLLEHQQAQEALRLLEHTEKHNDDLQNAYAVCLMRVGRVGEALKILRAMTFKDLPAIPAETSALLQANYATALLLSGDNLQAIDILNRLEDQAHPYVAKLKKSIDDFKEHLTWWERVAWTMTVYPSRRVPLGFAPGEI